MGAPLLAFAACFVGMSPCMNTHDSHPKPLARLGPRSEGFTAKTFAETGRMRRMYLDSKFGQLHVQDTGNEEDPPIICLHMAGSCSWQFRSVATELHAKGFRVVCPDMPGEGLSDPPPSPFDTWLDDIIPVYPQMLDQLGIESCHVLGRLSGTGIATELATQYPERVRKMVLCGAFPKTEEELQLQMAVDRKVPAFDVDESGAFLMASWNNHVGWLRPDEDVAAKALAMVVARYLPAALNGQTSLNWSHHMSSWYDQAAAIKALAHDTLLLRVEGDIVDEKSRRAEALRPDLRVATMQGNLDVMETQAQEFARLVADFLHDEAAGE